jgi:asparagine synthase (glutamine-hydrolysing)
LHSINSKSLSRLPLAKQFQLVDQVTYLNFLLERQDKASMGGALEARLPFLDQALIEAIAPIASSQLFDPQHLKKPLKRLLAKRMGDEFTYRSKVGFALPIEHWLQDSNGLGAYVEKALSPDFILWRMVDRQTVLNYLNGQTFALRQISYADDERHWLRWFLAVLAAAQEAFSIQEIA